MPPHRKFKCYVGLGSTKDKLIKMLDRYKFDTCAAVLGIVGPGLTDNEEGSKRDAGLKPSLRG